MKGEDTEERTGQLRFGVYPCEECGKKFVTKRALISHKVSHD